MNRFQWAITRAAGSNRWAATSIFYRPFVRLTGTVDHGEPVIQSIGLGMLGGARIDTNYPPDGSVEQGLEQAREILPPGELENLFDQLRQGSTNA